MFLPLTMKFKTAIVFLPCTWMALSSAPPYDIFTPRYSYLSYFYSFFYIPKSCVACFQCTYILFYQNLLLALIVHIPRSVSRSYNSYPHNTGLLRWAMDFLDLQSVLSINLHNRIERNKKAQLVSKIYSDFLH